MKRCPECGAETFVASAHVVEDWVVDNTGEFIAVSASCIAVAHYPDDDDLWECERCGYQAPGKEFNVKEDK